MKKSLYKFLIAAWLMAIFAGCVKVDNVNLNSPTADAIIQNPTVAELNNLVTGSESGMRGALAFYLDDVGVIGREMYRFSGSEPRYTGELLGGATSVLDSNAFYLTNPWGFSYAVVRNLNILRAATANCKSLSDAQRKGYNGFAKTISAYELLLNLNITNSNGIKTDVSDFDHLGPLVSKDQALSTIANMLDSARDDFSTGSVIFPLSNGFAGFSNAAGLLKFNRAIAARVAVYRQKWTDALTYLSQSFYNLNGNLNIGVYHVFSTNPGDVLNAFYLAQNSTGEIRPAHPSYATDLEAGDDRISKATLRTNPATQSGLTSNRDVWVYTSNTAPVPIIRNEELILIFAEASIQNNDLTSGVNALNKIRTSHALGNYAGAVTQAALITEMLKQRRYSLFNEGHRWVDMRRYNRLNQLPIDRTDDNVWTEFPIPVLER